MHPEQQIFCLEVKMKFPPWPLRSPFHQAKVLDCGSLDINGNNRFLFSECDYIGIDVVFGPNVTCKFPIHKYSGNDEAYDTIICTETLEHDMYWQESLRAMYRMLKPGGLLIITCATLERPEHGTPLYDPDASGTSQIPEMADYYRNLNETDFRSVWDMEKLFKDFEFQTGRDNQDLYFWGIKV